MGSFFGSGSNNTSSSSSSTSATDMGRWAPQQPYITSGMANAQNTYNQQMASGPYTGQLYAPINGYQTTAVDNGMGTGSGMLTTGGNLMNSGYGSTTSGLTNAGALASGSFNPGITSASTATVGNVPTSVSQANSGINYALNPANQVNNATVQAAGNTAASSPQTQALIQNSLNQISNTLNTSTLPSINAQAIAGGNMDSSRAGAAEGLAQQTAALSAGNIASQIQNNAYNTGAQLAETGQVANLNANLGAASAANASTGLGLTGQTSYNSNNLGLLNTQLGANGQLISGGNSALTTGGNLQQTGLNNQYTAGGLLQTNQQGQDTANYQGWQNAYNYPWQTLNNYANIAMLPSYGSTGTSSGTSTGNSTTTNSASGSGVLSGLMQMGAMAAVA
jgi:hypothetical protein